MTSPQGKRRLYLTVHEASGQTRDNEILWEPSFSEGCVRVEVKGSKKSTKVATHYQKVEAYTITWSEELLVEITDEDQELRIMLCKPRNDGPNGKKLTSVVAACGIFVHDILAAVPIDKYFEIFKPGDASTGLGGFVRIAMKASSPRIYSGNTPGMSEHVANAIQQRLGAYNQGPASTPPEDEPRVRRFLPVMIAGAAAAVILILKVVKK